MKARYFYLIHIRYLGYRFHGWQKQPNLKTVHQMVDKTVAFVLQHDRFKTIGSSRTDAKVSANHSAFELFLEEPINPTDFLNAFEHNLPSDISAFKIESVDASFNLIGTPKLKEYQYLFCYGKKPHPFSAAILKHFNGQLDIPLMKRGAQLFEGRHNFVKYCTKPSEKTQFIREIIKCEIAENTLYRANFFPDKSYVLHIHSKGFLRYQVRLIMGQLIGLGRHEITLDELAESLTGNDPTPLKSIAPSSGLMLYNITFEAL